MGRMNFGVNRMVAPKMPLVQFLDLVPRTGARGVELRNDLPGFDVIDSLSGSEVRDMLAARGLTVLTINAVQHFNFPSLRDDAISELRRLVGYAGKLGNPAIILCPHNATDDTRSAAQKHTDTESALRAISPILEDAGIIGLVEPLGFPECSLRSPVVAAEIIGRVGSPALRLTIDTFHYAVAGMIPAQLGTAAIPVEAIGFVHLSGVTAAGPVELFRDPDRVYIDDGDRVRNVETLRALLAAGYSGAASFEPFSAAVHWDEPAKIVNAITESMAYLDAAV
jgi:2-keto-myo-inositol isomerase